MSSVGRLEIEDRLRRLLGWCMGVCARARGRRFYCRALTGQSAYNLTINSDLSVSCNCQDYLGTGHLGSLRENTLQEILTGPTANAFRDRLAAGRLPIPTCSRCSELRTLESVRSGDHLRPGKVNPKGILLENTVLCNLKCLSCGRQQVEALRTRLSLSLDDVRLAVTQAAEAGVKFLSYFNLGEPFLSKNIVAELKIVREVLPQSYVQVSTNGVCLEGEEKQRAAMRVDRVVFSIDGADAVMAQRYQRGGSFDRAVANLRALVKYRGELKTPLIVWKYVLFWWNDRRRHIRKTIRLATEAGADTLLLTPTFSPWYGVSLRYRLDPFFRRIGKPTGEGVVVDLQPSKEPS